MGLARRSVPAAVALTADPGGSGAHDAPYGPVARFKDLCVDATDPVVLGTFWSRVLGLELHEQEGGDTFLTGATPQHTVWVNRVPEPKAVKHRLHLDVNVASVERLVEWGATVLDDQSFHWVLLADPEGGEFCAFVRDEATLAAGGPRAQSLYELVLDVTAGEDGAAAASALALWWAGVLGGQADDDASGSSSVDALPGAPFEWLCVVPVPEGKQGKNRVHLDLTCRCVDDLVAAGASVLRPQDDEIGWTVMADPAGNEFCAFVEG